MFQIFQSYSINNVTTKSLCNSECKSKGKNTFWSAQLIFTNKLIGSVLSDTGLRVDLVCCFVAQSLVCSSNMTETMKQIIKQIIITKVYTKFQET